MVFLGLPWSFLSTIDVEFMLHMTIEFDFVINFWKGLTKDGLARRHDEKIEILVRLLM